MAHRRGNGFSIGRLSPSSGREIAKGLTLHTGHIVGDPFALATISIATVRLKILVIARLEMLTSHPVGLADNLCRMLNYQH
jgi:hypothetical protein